MNEQAEKIKLIQNLNSNFIAEIRAANVDHDPLKIVADQEFTANDFQQAAELKPQLTVENHDFEPSDNGYLFTLQLANGFLHFTITIAFSTEKILNITVESMIRNYSTKAFAIIALEDFLRYFIRENPTEETNTSAKILLNHFAQEDSDLPIILRAQFEAASYHSVPALTFKLGQDAHLYKVQSLPNLVESARKHRVLELGKYFNRVVDVEQFDDDSRAWFDLLARIIDGSESVQMARDEFSIYSFKELPINQTIADEIDRLLHNGVALYDGKRRIHYQMREERMPVKVTVDQKSQKAAVHFAYLVPAYALSNLIRGSHNYYYYDAGVWQKYVNVDPNFFDRYGIEMGDNLTFGPKTIQTLGRKVLPRFEKSGHFTITGMKKLTESLPPEAEFVFKLDFQAQNLVCQPIVKYGDHEYRLEEKSSDRIARELAKEHNVTKLLGNLGFVQKNKTAKLYLLSIAANDKIDAFFDEGINKLKHVGKVQATAAFRRLLGNLKTKFNVALGIRLGENTLDLSVTGNNLSPDDVQAILTAYQQKRHYFMLRNGQIHSLESPSIEDLAAVMKNLGLSLKQLIKGKMAVPAYRAFYLEKMLENRDNLQYTSNSAFKKLVDDLANGKMKEMTVPGSLQETLRPYQATGFKWMTNLLNYNLGGLLADEMGLGKTLQVIAVLLARKKQTSLPSLIVVPASVVYNWEAEIKKFAPAIKTIVLGGAKKQRRQQLGKVTDEVLITSYDSLKRDLELYENLHFDLEVIDEAQNIKNAKAAVAAVAKAVKVIQANHRLALTGTPIENNLSELWSIFDFLMPGFLGEYEYFKNNYEKPIVRDEDQKKEKQLSQIIAPFILRRLKKDVLKDLPEKNEQIVYAQLSGRQAELYKAQTQKLIAQLNKQDDKDFKKQRFQVLAEITKLRELCCDPHLLYEDYRGKSAKLSASLELIQNSLADGHKVLLFSQFTSMLDLIKEKLNKMKILTFIITGSTPKQKRQELIKEFNQLKQPAIFLISLKAGGTGINLTSADVVIHYDPWWNVAAENQATDRAHRIGQKHNVQIYKLVAKGTIEEKIIDLQQRKEKLADEVLNGENFGSSTLNRTDLLQILER